jgi:hypothetical protein
MPGEPTFLKRLLDPSVASDGLCGLIVTSPVSLCQHVSHADRLDWTTHDRVRKRRGI